MDSLLGSTLIKLAFPVIAILLVLFVSKWRGLSWQEDLGLRRPKALMLMAWLGLWLLWIVISEWLGHVFGLDQPRAWPACPMLIVVLRVLAIGVLGPVAEEIVMRGILFSRLRRTAMGTVGAIGIIAIGWAALHYDYGVGTLGLIAVDGVVLGLARYQSKSLWVPVIMHALGNLFSIYQSLGA